MSKLMSLIRRAPKRFSAIVAMVAAAIVVPLAVSAWGPDRPTFTGANPAPYVIFNSITDNPQVGDERNFVRIRPAGTGNYGENVNIEAGKTYDVMVYYHNNAASGLNASGAGIAKDVMLRMQMAANVSANSTTKVTGFISASNAQPVKEVYDSATVTNTSSAAMDLGFVSGSAKVTSNGKVNGATLPDSVFTTGTPLGFDALDGTLPGCNEYAGYVIFQVKANQPNFTVSKQVHKTGTTGWKETEAVNPGDNVDFLITYKNTGSTIQNNVVLKDALPKGMTYVSGTTYVANTANPSGLKLDAKSDTATTTGANIGNYAPGAAAYIKLTAKVNANDDLPACGPNTLTNKATIETDNGNKSDTADVTVNKECKPPVAKYTCDALKVVTVDRTHFKFSTTYTAENATFKSATYVIKNAAGATVDTKTVNGTTNLDYTQATVGKYTVQSTLTFTVDGSDKTVTSDGCKGAFEVPKLPENPGIDIEKTVNGKKAVQVAVNTPFTYELTVKNTGDIDLTNVKVTDPAPANVQFMTASVGTIANNAWSYTIPNLKVGESKSFTITAKVTKEVSGAIKNTACVDAPAVPGNPDDCDTATVTVPPVGEITVCELATKQITTIKENTFDTTKYSKNLDDCKEIPTTPPELPHTGIGENIVAIVGLGALIASLGYYITSRRALS